MTSSPVMTLMSWSMVTTLTPVTFSTIAVLTALYPDVRLVIALGIALLVGSAVALLSQRKRTCECHTFPAIPWLALGAALYLALVALSGQPSAISVRLPASSIQHSLPSARTLDFRLRTWD